MKSTSQLSARVDRIAALRKEMKSSGVDAFVVNHTTALRYMFGFSGSTAMAIVTKSKIHFFTNDLYTVQVEKEVTGLDGLTIHIDRQWWNLVKSAKLAAKWTSLGFDPTRTTVSALAGMKKAISPAKLVEMPAVTDRIIRVKSKEEIKAIGEAATMASTAYEMMLGGVAAGMKERDVATMLATATRELGSEADAFDIIVVAGARSAMPHGRASDAVIRKGDVVTVDFGCRVRGLHSDMTRTFCVGTPKQHVMDVFAVLYDAHLTALDAAQPGITAGDLDAAARNIIDKAGYGDYFRHSLGHGLGYDVHEYPRVAHGNSAEVLEPGMVITIEPGIYLPGKFGMRVEDDVVIGTKAPSILTTAPRELVIV